MVFDCAVSDAIFKGWLLTHPFDTRYQERDFLYRCNGLTVIDRQASGAPPRGDNAAERLSTFYNHAILFLSAA